VITRLPAGPAAPGATTGSAPRNPRTPVVRNTTALDVAVDGKSRWVLKRDSLASLGDARVGRRVSLTGLHFPADSAPRLAVDTVEHRIWVVIGNAAPSRMIEYDEATLHRLRDITWPRLILDAVAYAGRLYLTTDYGTAELASGWRAPRLVGGLGGATGPVVVDPSRHRLIAIDLGYPTNVWTIRPGHRPVEATTLLDINRGSLAVVDGAIWVGGYLASGAVLERLDPRTFRPVLRTRPRLFDPGAVVIAGGARVLWVGSGSDSALLGCVSATSGRVEERWELPAVRGVVSNRHGALVATEGGVLGLIEDRCEG
jgi:hypothetical protein